MIGTTHRLWRHNSMVEDTVELIARFDDRVQ